MFLYQKKLIICEVFLCVILGIAIIFYTHNNQEIAQQQDTSLYYVNISGKQRVLAQRIVFLSQIIATSYVLKNQNHENFLELRNCINELTAIHKVLQNFVVSTIIDGSHNSTLDDVYFGSGNLAFKIESFLENANAILYVNSFGDILRVNRALLQQLEEDEGLLTSLELATLSQQIYAQNLLKVQQSNTKWFLWTMLFVVGLQILLLFFGVVRNR